MFVVRAIDMRGIFFEKRLKKLQIIYGKNSTSML